MTELMTDPSLSDLTTGDIVRRALAVSAGKSPEAVPDSDLDTFLAATGHATPALCGLFDIGC